MAVNMPLPPPTSALPQLPVSRLRGPSTTPDASRVTAVSPSAPKLALRTPSKVQKPTGSSSGSHAVSSPSIPTLRSTSAHQSQSQEQSVAGNKEVRRSVSIANFPQPPKIQRKTGVESKYSSAAYYSVREPTRAPEASQPQSGSLRTKKLKPKTSYSNLAQMESAGPISTLSDTSKIGKAGKNTQPSTRASNDLANLRSPDLSRSSSAQDSYSTSATTFEEVDDRKGRDAKAGAAISDKKRRESENAGKGNVIVSVRVRPDAGGDKSSAKDWLVDSRQSLVSYRGKEGGDYNYDNVFAPHDQNDAVYDTCAKRLVRRVMEGYSGTVFAYGMTGTGKTFSMQGTATSPGVIPLAITDIFSFIRETPHMEFLLRVSFLEIYNEKIHDLLRPQTDDNTQPEEIKIREDPARGVYASPLTEEIVLSPTQLLRVIARGDASRKTRSTQYNAQSSRSHAVVQIVVESREHKLPAKGQKSEKRTPMSQERGRVSVLNMIDLAGSERAAENKERRTEGAHINKSLLTLGTIIARLSGSKDNAGNPTDKDGKHLPYRDSKLTRLLQPTLSGNSLVSILCTIQLGSLGSVATANTHTGETLNTLKFAARAKNNIVSHAKRAEAPAGSQGLLERYRAEIRNLQAQLEDQRKVRDEESSAKEVKPLEMEELRFEKEAEQRRDEQILEMQLARTALNDRIEHLNRLILSSKSSGVNSSGKMSSVSMHPTSTHPSLSGRHKSETSVKNLQSLRSSATRSTAGAGTPPLQRTGSMGSTITAAGANKDLEQSPISSQGNEEDLNGDFGHGNASAKARISALQATLSDKNRYISNLEQRLLQARRSSHSKTSRLSSPTTQKTSSILEEDVKLADLVKEKDAEIADLRARLDDKNRMVSALKSAARHRDVADLASEPTSPVRRRDIHHHQSNESKDSKVSGGGSVASNGSGSGAGTNGKGYQSPVSPVQLLAPHKEKQEREMKRKSIDEMTKILDGMIQDRVQTGGLVIGANGIVRPAHTRSKESLTGVPSVGALAAQLRPTSTISEAEHS
ncbi:Kinesin-like protein kip2 [Lecanora helva]